MLCEVMASGKESSPAKAVTTTLQLTDKLLQACIDYASDPSVRAWATSLRATSLGRVAQGLNHPVISQVIRLTDVLETYYENRKKHSAVASGVGVAADYVCGTLVGLQGGALVAGGLATSEVGIGIPLVGLGAVMM